MGEDFVDRPVYIEVNRFDEFLGYSLTEIAPSKKGNKIKKIEGKYLIYFVDK